MRVASDKAATVSEQGIASAGLDAKRRAGIASLGATRRRYSLDATGARNHTKQG